MLGFDGEYLAIQPKTKFCCFLVKNGKKSTIKYSIEKPISLNFVNLSPRFCPTLSEETKLYLQLDPDLLILHFLKFLIFEKSHWLFKLIFNPTQLQKIPKYDIFQKNTIFHFSVKYEFRTKRCCSCSRAVFMKTFYFSSKD